MPGADTLSFAQGEAIVRAGEPGDRMFVVLAGEATLTLPGGATVRFGVGEFFGELAVIDNRPRSATVVAAADGTVVQPIDQARFVYLVSHQPAFALTVLSALSQHLRGTPAPPDAATAAAASYTPEEIRPGLVLLRSRGRACNAVLVAGRDRTLLVDTGLGSSAPALLRALRDAGRPADTLDLVALTHEHIDHAGGLAHLPGRPLVAAHPLAANKLALHDEAATVSGVIGEAMGPVAVDLCLAEGSVIDVAPFRFEVLHTPGHTSSCVSFLDHDADVLICGDTFMAGGAMGGVFGSGSISDTIHSLRRLERIGLGTVLPGHGRASAAGKADAAGARHRAEALLANTRALFQALGGQRAFDTILASLRGLNA